LNEAVAIDDSAGRARARWGDALLAAALVAVDPAGTGAAIRARPGPVREAWLEALGALLPLDMPRRRLPAHVTEDRLLGGLDLAATLKAGKPVAERGLLADADGGLVIVPMAERLAGGVTAQLARALDRGELTVEREGLGLRMPARIGVVALDEGAEPEERLPAALADRLALTLDLTDLAWRDGREPSPLTAEDVVAARERLARITAPADLPDAFCKAAAALGIVSLRAPLLAVRVARAAAALMESDTVDEEAAAVAARLVLGPRATCLPPAEDEEAPPDEPEPPEGEPDEQPDEQEEKPTPDQPLEDVVIDAAEAAIPEELMRALEAGLSARAQSGAAGVSGALAPTNRRGRPIGTRRGEPGRGVRLNVVETLRAAAPWQPLRRREAGASPTRVQVRRDDFRITRFKQRNESAAIFVVDASGSAALHRLAEAKGAVELLLADCYTRRDHVALIAFRNRTAELLLPPTRSLTRAKNSITGLPGGGGTPLAAGLDAALALAETVKRRGQTPAVVLLTDGRANIARDGTAGRGRAGEDALQSATAIRLAALTSLVVDVSNRPHPAAEKIAQAMAGAYLPLPRADAQTLSTAVRAATDGERGAA
jgi:magnesium chelatase subunit D